MSTSTDTHWSVWECMCVYLSWFVTAPHTDKRSQLFTASPHFSHRLLTLPSLLLGCEILLSLFCCLLCSCGPVVALVGPSPASVIGVCSWETFQSTSRLCRGELLWELSEDDPSCTDQPIVESSVSPVVWRKISESEELRHVSAVGFFMYSCSQTHTQQQKCCCVKSTRRSQLLSLTMHSRVSA